MGTGSGLALILAIICSASMAIFMRFYQASGNNRYAMILGNYLTCTVIGFLVIRNKSLLTHASGVTYACGIIAGVLFVVSLVCMQSSIARNGAILSSAFSKLGLLVPLAVSILYFHEQPGILQGAGMLAVILAIRVFSHHEKTSKAPVPDLLFLLVVLLTNGASDVMAKVYSEIGSSTEETVYIFFIFLSASVLTFLLLLMEKKRTGKKTSLRDLVAGIFIGIPNYCSSILVLRSLATIPSFIVYPVFASGSILLVTLVSIPLFREYLDRRQVTGLVLILFALVLLNI